MTASTIAYMIAFGCIAVFCVGKQYFRATRTACPLPPGPPGLPWIGNAIGIDTSRPWLTYREWAKQYGDIVYSRLLGKDIIIINSEKVAKDLLDKCSSNNSDRPYFITNELCGIDWNSALLPYGDRWRLHRRFFHQTFRIDAVTRFLPLQHDKACQLLRHLFCTPENFDEHVFAYTGTIILNSAYDYDPPTQDDELFKLVAKVQQVAISVVRPDVAIAVATFPMLLKLPAWFPCMSFKTEMATASKLARQYVETAFEYSLRGIARSSSISYPGKQASGIAPSMVHDALQNVERKGAVPDELWMKALKEAAATAFLAGSETSHSVLMTFFLVMMLNPVVQEKAQAQIDAVTGNARLPSIDDRPSLPLIDAILWETLRYSPITPLSVPHATTNDSVYSGFRIPKGALVFANVWSMTHDESRFPDAHAFTPERFLNDDGSLKPNDIKHIVFGFGRRICVGRHFADASVWSVIAKVLAVFKIMKPVDESGAEISTEPRFSGGLAVHPLPFRCRIVPRISGMDIEKLEILIAASTV